MFNLIAVKVSVDKCKLMTGHGPSSPKNVWIG